MLLCKPLPDRATLVERPANLISAQILHHYDGSAERSKPPRPPPFPPPAALFVGQTEPYAASDQQLLRRQNNVLRGIANVLDHRSIGGTPRTTAEGGGRIEDENDTIRHIFHRSRAASPTLARIHARTHRSILHHHHDFTSSVCLETETTTTTTIFTNNKNTTTANGGEGGGPIVGPAIGSSSTSISSSSSSRIRRRRRRGKHVEGPTSWTKAQSSLRIPSGIFRTSRRNAISLSLQQATDLSRQLATLHPRSPPVPPPPPPPFSSTSSSSSSKDVEENTTGGTANDAVTSRDDVSHQHSSNLDWQQSNVLHNIVDNNNNETSSSSICSGGGSRQGKNKMMMTTKMRHEFCSISLDKNVFLVTRTT